MSEYAEKIIKHCEKNKDFVCGLDGYYAYWPQQAQGALPESALRVIADHLRKLNAEWDAEVQRQCM